MGGPCTVTGLLDNYSLLINFAAPSVSHILWMSTCTREKADQKGRSSFPLVSIADNEQYLSLSLSVYIQYQTEPNGRHTYNKTGKCKHARALPPARPPAYPPPPPEYIIYRQLIVW